MKLIALLTIPDEILTSILVCWSELRSIAKLDLACCNTNIRDEFLNCFRHKYVIFTNYSEFSTSSNSLFMNWVFTREIKLSRMVVEPVSLLSPCGSDLQYNSNLLSVTSLTISGEFDNQIDFAHIINRCVNLKRLDEQYSS
jgi:hypothetical protein